MKTIKVRFADIAVDSNRDCYGKQSESSYICFNIRNCLKRMYVLDEESPDPDYVFTFVPVGGAKGFEYGKYNDAVIIFVQCENVFPDLYCFDYAIGTDPVLQYGERYLYLPPCLNAEYTRQCYDRILTKHKLVEDNMARRKFCAMTVSNGNNAAHERENFFHQLSAYKTVDSGGRFLNNIGKPVEDKLLFESEHKFTIAFDNVENGILQEKIEMAFAAHTVPIYWGTPAVTRIYNENAFVNCHAFDSFADVVKRVREIDNNDELYLSMLREPAFAGEAKTLAQWEEELSAFLRMIIEQPKEKAIKRRTENWSGIIQRMRLEGFRRRYPKVKRSQAVKSTLYKCYLPAKASLEHISAMRTVKSLVIKFLEVK